MNQNIKKTMVEDDKGNRGMPEIKKIIPIPSSGNFFRIWVEVLKPIHKLTDRESDVLAAFLKKRFELQQTAKDPDMIDSYLMSAKIKKEIRESTLVSPVYFQMIFGKFRRSNIIINDEKGRRINPWFIPRLSKDDKDFCLAFIFGNPNDS